jgi:outer membrane protein OmpA-like peptidoglycan-associated protein
MSIRACKRGLAVSLVLGGADILLLNLWIAPRVLGPGADRAPPLPLTAMAMTVAAEPEEPPPVAPPPAAAAIAAADPVAAVADRPEPPPSAEADRPSAEADRPPAAEPPAAEPPAAEPAAEPEREPAPPPPAEAGPAPDSVAVSDTPDGAAGRRITLYFRTDRATLSDAHRAELDRLAGLLAADPALGIEIDGHADARGSPNDNNYLAKRRTDRVADYLRTQGVSGRRLQLRSYGERRPVATGWTEEALRQNRRVELLVLEEMP